jgi:hypothetical protein
MADFLSKAKALNRETIELLGEKIEVRGISIGELVAISKPKKGAERDSLDIAAELIAACCYRPDGSKLVPDAAACREWAPVIFNELNAACERVNASVAGNSKATGKSS